jgi:hypothetical protein
MSELDIEVHEMSKGDERLYSMLVEEINEHFEGLRSFSELSTQAQIVIERWETGATAEINGVEPEDSTYEE